MGREPELLKGASEAALGPYLERAVGPGWARVTLEPITGGKSNLTYLVRAGDDRLVLRRPPLGHVLPTAHDMTREFRILSALHGTSVPVPRPVALCTDEGILGAVFFLMEFVEGHVVRAGWPAGYASSEAERRAVGSGLVDALAELHGLDWRGLGLESFGRPKGFMERQIRRWVSQWELSQTRALPRLAELAALLRERLPSSPEATIVHGDFRLDNVILDRRRPGHIAGIVDWEMSTIGDPLSDLGLLLVYWVEATDPDTRREALAGIGATSIPGFLSRAAAIDRYASRSERDLGSLPFYVAFGFFKLAVILEGIHARHLQGKTVGGGFEGVGDRVPPLLELGLETLESGRL